MRQELQDYMLTELKNLMDIPSPTGYTKEVQEYVKKKLVDLGYEPYTLHKGGVICCLGGEKNALMLASHIDTLGACVKTIKDNGSLKVSNIGGLQASNVETETVTVFTRFHGSYEGTFQLENASSHVNHEVSAAVRDFDQNLEILLDEEVSSVDEVKDLGIENGDIVAVNPRFMITKKGYIKSRFLDDKASAAVLLTLAKAVQNGDICLGRKVYLNFTVFEEVGHGGSAGIPEDVEDMLSVDMGCVGTGLHCKETQVSICAKDSGGPYHYDLVTELVQAAKDAKIDYAIDIYPYYGSDVECTLRAGYDIRHGLIGPGVYASHGYERSHVKGLANTYKLLQKYISV